MGTRSGGIRGNGKSSGDNLNLFRGDTRLKGSDLVVNENTIDYEKNKAGFLFFTDSIDEAKDYANSAMNDNLRKNYGIPNITSVFAKNVKMLNFTDVEKGAFNHQVVFNFINENLFRGKMNFKEYSILTYGSVPKNSYDLNSAKNDFNLLSKNKGHNLYSSLHAVHIANGESGLFLKKLLKKNNYDGFIFKDTSPSKGLHYGFVSNKKIKIVNNVKM